MIFGGHFGDVWDDFAVMLEVFWQDFEGQMKETLHNK